MYKRCIVTGCPRTGTTMLHTFLNLSHDVYIAFEKALYRTPELRRTPFVKRLMQKGKFHMKPSLGLVPRTFSYFKVHHDKYDYEMLEEFVPDELTLAYEVTNWLERNMIDDVKIVGDKLPAYHKNLTNIVQAYDIKKIIITQRDPKDIAFALRRPRGGDKTVWQEDNPIDAKLGVIKRFNNLKKHIKNLDEVDCEIYIQDMADWDTSEPFDVYKGLMDFLEVGVPDEAKHYIEHLVDPRRVQPYYQRDSYKRSIDPNLKETKVDEDFAEVCEDWGYKPNYPDSVLKKIKND